MHTEYKNGKIRNDLISDHDLHLELRSSIFGVTFILVGLHMLLWNSNGLGGCGIILGDLVKFGADRILAHQDILFNPPW